MRPSTSLMGASRLPLTTKRGNKDFYKGEFGQFHPERGSVSLFLIVLSSSFASMISGVNELTLSCVGTGQAYVPGGGHRTGPPGNHVIRGKGKYRILDERVRYFVSPGVEALEGASARGVGPSRLAHSIPTRSFHSTPFRRTPLHCKC